MAFESFDDLARVGLKRAAMKAARVIMKSEFSDRQRPQTVFRFSDDLVERAGWSPGTDSIELMIDRTDMAIRARKVAVGGYKLIGNRSARPYLKFTAARGMPIADEAAEATDVVVVGGVIVLSVQKLTVPSQSQCRRGMPDSDMAIPRAYPVPPQLIWPIHSDRMCPRNRRPCPPTPTASSARKVSRHASRISTSNSSSN